MSKTIIVTGSAGFIGFHTAKKLLDQGNTVIGIDNINSYYSSKLKTDRNAILLKYRNYHFYKIDLKHIKKLGSVFKKHKIDQICHLAAQAGVRYSITNPFIYLKSNIDGTLNLFELAKKNNIKEVVFSSSSSVYGNNKKTPFSETDFVDHPISLYAATKKAAELIAHVYHSLFGIHTIGLRFFTVYGPWGRPDMAIFKFTERLFKKKTIDVYNNGNMSRDFTYIDDIVAGIISALKKVNHFSFEIINLGNHKPEDLTKMISLLEKHIGQSVK